MNGTPLFTPNGSITGLRFGVFLGAEYRDSGLEMGSGTGGLLCRAKKREDGKEMWDYPP